MVKLTSLIAGSMLVFSQFAAAQLAFADARLHVRQNSFTNGTSTSVASSATPSAVPSTIPATTFVDNILNDIRDAILAAKVPDYPFEDAYNEVEGILSFIRNGPIYNILVRLAAVLFPDLVTPLARRAEVSIDETELASVLNDAVTVLTEWKASSAYQGFLSAIAKTVGHFNSAQAVANIQAKLGSLFALAEKRLSQAAANNAAVASALSSLFSLLNSIWAEIWAIVENGVASSGTISGTASATGSGAASGSSGAHATITEVTTYTTVIGATSTETITLCTECPVTVISTWTTITKTTAGATITVTEPCEVTETPESTTCIYHGGQTITITATVPLTTYTTVKGTATYTVTEPCIPCIEKPTGEITVTIPAEKPVTTTICETIVTSSEGQVITVTKPIATITLPAETPVTTICETIVSTSSGKVVTETKPIITVTVPIEHSVTTICETIITSSQGQPITVTKPITAITIPVEKPIPTTHEVIVTTSSGQVITKTKPVVIVPTPETPETPKAPETPETHESPKAPGSATIATVSQTAPAVATGTSTGINQVNGAVSTNKNVYGLVGGALLAAVFLA